jgi:cytoskeleton protein RodZ
MKTKSVGELLQEARNRHRLSIDELSKRSRIRSEYIRSLESNKFELLPAAVFVKGYIRTYGQMFGFDADALLALLRRDYKESAKGKLVPREFIKPVLKRRQLLTPVTAVIVLIGVILFSLLTYVGFQWYQLNQPPALTVAEPIDHATVAAQVVVSGQSTSEAVVAVNGQPVAVASDGSFKTEVFLPREGLTSITVTASDRRGKTNTLDRLVLVKF